MGRKFRFIGLLLVLSLGLLACETKMEPEESHDFIKEIEEEKSDGEKNLVRNKEIEEELEGIFQAMLEEKDYKNYSLVTTEVWVYKDQRSKIYDGRIEMDLKEEDKDKAEEVFKSTSEYIKEALAKKYDYERLELNWENENYREKDKKEVIIYK